MQSGKVSLAALLACVALLLVGASSASAVSPQFVGLNWDGQQGTMESAADWNAIQHSGTKLFRLEGDWKIVNDHGNWKEDPAWQQSYDKYFQLAAERDITILPYLYGRKTSADVHRFYTSSEWNEWLQFVWTFVQRYGRGGTFWAAHPSLPYKPVTTWEVWNEENLALNNPKLSKSDCIALGYHYDETAGVETCVQPLVYAEFFNATSKTINEAQNAVRKAGEPVDIKVLTGGLYEQPDNEGVQTAAQYFGNIAAKNKDLNTTFKERNNGYGLHPYSFPNNEAGRLAGLEKTVTDTRTYLNSYDSSAKPIWITEFGWTVGGEGLGEKQPGGNEGEQAKLLTDSFNWLKAQNVPKNIEYAAWYDYKDVNSDYHWAYHCGLRTTPGVYRQSWYAFEAQTGASVWPYRPVAFQSNTGDLWTVSSEGVGTHLGLALASGTSPSVAQYQSGYVVAFAANTGALWIYTPWGGAWTNGLQVAPGTSPAVAELPNGSFEVTYQGTNGNLYTYSPETGAIQLNLGMAAGSSPSIVKYQSGYLVAFKANTGAMWIYTPWGGAWTNGLQIGSGTDPAVARLPNNSFEVAYQGTNGNLYAYSPEAGAKNLGLGMAAGSSPG